LDEKKLVEMLHSKNRDTFLHLIEMYNKLLWVVVASVLGGVGTNEDIEECISDVYVRLWLNPEIYDPQKGTLKTFITIVAKRKAFDKYRQLSKRKIIEFEEASFFSEDELSENVIKNDLYNELFTAIQSLKEPDKEIMIRRYFLDEKPSFIANKISLSVKEIKNRLYQSKLRLKEMLKSKEVADYES